MNNIENAIACGEKRKSALSGYIHHAYENLQENDQCPIPVRENIYYILALFRSRNGERVAEGKELLSRLLYFQNESGNFPVYLHQFPHCANRYLVAELLIPMRWILKEFGTILGDELKERAEQSFTKAVDYCLSEDEKRPARYPLRYVIAKIAVESGTESQIHKWVEEGGVIFSELETLEEHLLLWDHESLAMMLTAGSDHWEHISNYWHPKLGVFTGLSILEHQYQHEPRVTLLDLIMGCVQERPSQRTKQDSIVHLQAALTPKQLPPVQIFTPHVRTGQLGAHNWVVKSDENHSCCMISKPEPLPSSREYKFTPFRLLWGNSERLHSFVCQGGNAETIDFQEEEGKIVMTYALGEPPESDEKIKNRDINFFIDRQDSLKINVNGSTTTTFRLDEVVNIETEEMKINLKFQLEDGKGNFLGHITPGNRPSQTDLSVKTQFQTYDWQIHLRTVHRDGPCILKVIISYTQ